LDIEVKSRKGFIPLAALKQAAKRRRPEHELPPHGVLRMPGQGEAAVPQFVVVRYLEDDTEILAELVALRQLVAGRAAAAREVLDPPAREKAVWVAGDGEPCA